MQDIEQNMDDLFRKAADNYPLKINDSRWEDIEPAILNESVDITVAKKRSFRKYTSLLLLFLFLFISDGIITDTLKTGGTKYPIPGENKINYRHTRENESGNKDIKHKKSIPQSETYYSGQSGEQETSTTTSLYLLSKTYQKQTGGVNEQARKDRPASTFPMVQLNPLTKPDITLSAVEQKMFPVGIKTMPGSDKTVQIENKEKGDKAIVQKEAKHSAGLYVGPVAGLLFDEIENQGLKKTGFSLGFITGYQFKNRLSFESGLLFAKKPYYSTGKYFKMDKMGGSMPSGMAILSLEGANHTLEIPVKIKYDLLHGNKSNFFSSAGITSYIMTYEKNDYLVTMNGVQQTMISSYKNKSRSFAATLDIGAGYEHKIGRSNYFRIEPYIQIPLKGMGVGSMQMVSTGLRIGITKFTN